MQKIRVVVSIGEGNSRFIGLPESATISTLYDKLLEMKLLRDKRSDRVFRIKSGESKDSYIPAGLDIPVMNGDFITVRLS